MELRMKESPRKGIANHLEPESCEGDREAALEALTGAYAGRDIELRNRQSGGRRSCPVRKATRRCASKASASLPGGVVDAQACIETPCCENRETPLSPAVKTRQADGRKR